MTEGKAPFRNYRRRSPGPKPEFSPPPNTRALPTPKHLGYLHAKRGLSVPEIIARYPNTLNNYLVHLGLSEYYKHQEQFEEEFKREAKFNVGSSLSDASLKLPTIGMKSLVEVEEMFQASCEATRQKMNRESESKRLLIRKNG